MGSLRTTVLALSVAALVASPAFSQPPGGGRGGRGGFGMMQMGRGGGAALLNNASVQEELKLDDKQKEKIKEFAQKQREAMQDLSPEERREKMQEMAKEGEKFVKDVLTADQQKRFKQIQLQQGGFMALNSPEVQKELKLTDEQKEKLKALGDDMRKDMQEMFQGGGGGDRQEMMTKMNALRKEYQNKAHDVLTAEQKKQWQEMTGKPFEIKMERPNRRDR